MVGLAGIARGHLRRVLTAILVVLLMAVGLTGCATHRPHPIETTASLPPDVLAKGQLATVFVDGQLSQYGVQSMPVVAVGVDANGQPYADVVLAPSDSGETPMHLGETITVEGIPVTLVSFDYNGAQSVTFLVGG